MPAEQSQGYSLALTGVAALRHRRFTRGVAALEQVVVGVCGWTLASSKCILLFGPTEVASSRHRFFGAKTLASATNRRFFDLQSDNCLPTRPWGVCNACGMLNWDVMARPNNSLWGMNHSLQSTPLPPPHHQTASPKIAALQPSWQLFAVCEHLPRLAWLQAMYWR